MPLCVGEAVCRIIVSFARVRRIGVWFGFVRSALLHAVAACIVLSFGAMPGLCCFLRLNTLCASSHACWLVAGIRVASVLTQCLSTLVTHSSYRSILTEKRVAGTSAGRPLRDTDDRLSGRAQLAWTHSRQHALILHPTACTAACTSTCL